MKQETKPATTGKPFNITQIFRQYQSQLKGFIARQVRTKEDTEDILQNVFYQLSRNDPEENPIEQISAWLYTVTRNQITDWRRKRKETELPGSSCEEGDDFVGELTLLLLDEEASPETDFMKSLIWEQLDLALSELPEEQSSVFRLTELEGISFKEIAEATGITVNTLISRKRYAVLHLRKRLAQLYQELL